MALIQVGASAMKKKIGVLFTQAQDGLSAPTKIHGLLIRYFDRECIEVHLACTTGTGGEKPPSLKTLENIPDLHIRPTNFGPTIFRRSMMDIARDTMFTGPQAIISLLGLAKYIKEHDIDIIHTGEKPRDAVYAVLLAKLTGVKSIIHIHAKCEDWFGSRMFWAMKQADAIIGVSQFVAQSIIDRGYSQEKVHYVLNSMNVSDWIYDTDGSAVRREFDVATDVPLLTIISRLVLSKGHAQLLKALVMVKAKVPCFKLLIVGDDDPHGLQKGYSHLAELKKLTHELGLSEQVIFSGYRTDVQQILAACDLYTMPASDEGFGLAFVEAMAMKKAIIAQDSGGASEVVEHGESGLLSPPGDIPQLAENILTLINNPALRSQMGEYGRMRVEQHFNAKRMAKDVESIYRLILGKSMAVQQQTVSGVHVPDFR
jgi:glycosyltransferase involved in cell wall biosynthesis